jgi:hypothetical protein
MSAKYPYGIGPGVHWLIFAGFPLAIWAIYFAFTEPHHALESAVGEPAFAYLVFFVPAAIMIAGMVLYDHFPKRLVIPVGIVGWLVNFSVFFWFFWFGPGALRHH